MSPKGTWQYLETSGGCSGGSYRAEDTPRHPKNDPSPNVCGVTAVGCLDTPLYVHSRTEKQG